MTRRTTGGVATTVGTRLTAVAARAVTSLPPAARLRLAGGTPVVVDGQTLDSRLQVLFAFDPRARRSHFAGLSAEAARAVMRYETEVTTGPVVPVAAAGPVTVDGAAGPLAARLYRTPGGPRTGRPLLVFLHGGGFTVCDLDTHDGVARLLCRHAGVDVLSVAYRLAPEHPFPAGVDDAYAALRWAYRHADRLGADPDRIAIGGDSAGATLATVACQLARDDGGPVPALQLLLYPTTDRTREYPSGRLFAAGFYLDAADLDWYAEQYLGGRQELDPDPRVSPIRGALGGLPPAVVATAGFDPLRDQGEAYAQAMRAAGVPVTLRRYGTLVHGFANLTGVCPAAAHAVAEVGGAVRATMDTTAGVRPGRTRRVPQEAS